jgi:spermidine/putrescine transport system substrate-binding protein
MNNNITGGSMSDQNDYGQLAPDWVRGLTQHRIGRRGALQFGAASVLLLALEACGVSGKSSNSTSSQSASEAAKKFWAAQKKTGVLNFANWPLYIDVSDTNEKDHPSLDEFTKQTGIKVTYSEVIQENASFFGKIQPELAAGQATGYDIIVITNGSYLDKLRQLNYLVALDQSKMVNFYKNASPLVKNPSYDPGNQYTMAWQSGITGIGYDPKRLGHDITSWQQLADTSLKGKVGMFGDTQDLPNSALLAVGVKPEDSDEKDWQKAADWLKAQRPLVRKYYEQDYIDPLSKGDIWASMAWSGDVFQANASGASLKFVVPEEGAVSWTDNMCIPVHAAHPFDAMTYMDFVYQPDIAAMLAEYINYITPVPAAKAVILQDASAATTADDKAYYEGLATSPLIFPAASDVTKLHRYRVLTADEEKTWNALFEPIYQS